MSFTVSKVEELRNLEATASEVFPARRGERRAKTDQTRAQPLEHPETIKLGRFTLLERIGGGTMGDVYAAYDEKLDRKVAIKLVRPDATRRNHADKRLLREAQALARVSHPNVVPVYDAGTYEGRVYIAMELVRGVTLSKWMRELGDMPERERRDAILAQLLAAGRGLAAAHKAGVVHRDFKPENVLVGDDGRVRVVDFGLARALVDQAPGRHAADAMPDAMPDRATHGGDDEQGPSADQTWPACDSDLATERTQDMPGDPAVATRARPGKTVPKASLRLTSTGTVLGTPRYMAPEQMRGEEADRRSDQFTFCVAVYRALFGAFPYPGQTFPELKAALDAGTMQVPERAVDVPARIRKALLRGLSTKPSERFASMDELLGELEPAPRTRTARGFMAAGLATIMIVGATLYLAVAKTPEDPCAAQRRGLDALWSPARKAEVAGALRQSGLPYAASTWQRVQGALDSYARAWSDQAVAACQDTSQSAPVHDKRVLCLDRGKRQFAALVAELGKPGRDHVEHALTAAASLPDVGVCSDLESMIYDVAPPGPGLASGVETIRAALTRARVLESLGNYQDALDVARPTLADAEALDYPPVRAEALYEVARLLGTRNDKDALDQSETLYFEALYIAEAERHDRLAVDIRRDLMVQVLRQHASMKDAHKRWRHYQAAVERAGGHAGERAELYHQRGQLHRQDGEYAQAAEQERRALVTIAALPGHELDQARYAEALANALVDSGDTREAMECFEKALDIIGATLGPDHPRALKQAFNYGLILLKIEQLDRAREIVAAALETWTARYGEDDQFVAKMHTVLAGVALRQGRLDQAAAHVDASLRIYRQTAESGHRKLAGTLVIKGDIESARGAHQEALTAYTRALDIRRRHLDKNHYFVCVSEGAVAQASIALERHGEAALHLDNAERIVAQNPEIPVAVRGWVLLLRGQLLVATGRFHDASNTLEQALAMLEDPQGGAENRALAAWTLARALHGSGTGSMERIFDLATSARRFFAAQGPAGTRNEQEIHRWLATLPDRSARTTARTMNSKTNQP